MTTRFSFWSEEQRKIQAKYDVQVSKEAFASLTERIKSLESLGKLTEKESTKIQESIKQIMNKIEKAGD